MAGLIWRSGRAIRLRRTTGFAVPLLRPALVPEVWDLLLAGVIVSLVAVHIAYWTPGQMYGPRYYFEAIGAMVLLSSRGILGLSALLGLALRSLVPKVPSPRLLTTGLLLVVVAGMVIWNFNTFAPARFREFTGWYNINADGLRTVKAAHISNAVVFVREEEWTDYAPFFSQNTPELDTNIVYAIDQGDADRMLMMEYPGRSYYRYANGTLTKIPGP